jgi:hypothetical protein
MNLFKWLTRRWSIRGVGLSFYKRGMTRAKNHDQQGAMDDYTSAIDLHDAPAEVRAMARYNRALLYAAAKVIPKAVDDLNAVLAMTAPLRRIKSAARQTLERMQRGHHPETA